MQKLKFFNDKTNKYVNPNSVFVDAYGRAWLSQSQMRPAELEVCEWAFKYEGVDYYTGDVVAVLMSSCVQDRIYVAKILRDTLGFFSFMDIESKKYFRVHNEIYSTWEVCSLKKIGDRSGFDLSLLDDLKQDTITEEWISKGDVF